MLPPVINEQVRLSIGAGPGQRTVAVAFGLVFAAVGTAFVVLPLLADDWMQWLTGADSGCTPAGDVDLPPGVPLPPEIQDCGSQNGWWSDGTGLDWMRFIGLVGIPVVLVGAYLALHALRTAAWLQGTRARVRGALRTRIVDLATAEITAEVLTHRRNQGTSRESIERLPTIVARDPATGRKVTIPLHGAGSGPLPPHELRALADAMTRGRSTGGRDADVHTLADQLRTMAANPLGL